MAASRYPAADGQPLSLSPYDEALAQRVLDRIAQGEMLRDLWRDPALPTRGDLRRWRHADPAFSRRLREAVNRARSKRMSTYDPATAETICLRLCLGESLRGVCADRDMPCVATVFEWRKEQPDFARAQLAQLRWWVGKLSPKKYGPHKRIDLTAPPTGGETTEVVVRRFAKDGETEAP